MVENKDEIRLKDLETISQFINFEVINNFTNSEYSIFGCNIQQNFIHEKKIRTTIAVRTVTYITN